MYKMYLFLHLMTLIVLSVSFLDFLVTPGFLFLIPLFLFVSIYIRNTKDLLNKNVINGKLFFAREMFIQSAINIVISITSSSIVNFILGIICLYLSIVQYNYFGINKKEEI